MTYDEFVSYANNSMHETIYVDSEGRRILVIRLIEAYALFNHAIRQEREACALAAERSRLNIDGRHGVTSADQHIATRVVDHCAAAIRARGEK